MNGALLTHLPAEHRGAASRSTSARLSADSGSRRPASVHRAGVAILAVVSAICGLSPAAHGQTRVTWDSTTTNSAWATGGNWLGGSSPTSTQVAVFSGSAAVNPLSSGTGNLIAGLMFTGTGPAANGWEIGSINVGSSGIRLTGAGLNLARFNTGTTVILRGSQTWMIGDGILAGGTNSFLVMNSAVGQSIGGTVTPITLTIDGGGVLTTGGPNDSGALNVGSGTVVLQGNTFINATSPTSGRSISNTALLFDVRSGLVFTETTANRNLTGTSTLQISAGGAYVGSVAGSGPALANGASVTLAGGYFSAIGSPTTTGTFGRLEIGGGGSQFGASNTARVFEITSASRNGRGTLDLTGFSIGAGNSGTWTVTSSTNAFSASLLGGSGTISGTSTETNIAIIPWAVGGTSGQNQVATLGNGFVTYDSTQGLRLLRAENYLTNSITGTDNNVRFMGAQTFVGSGTANAVLLLAQSASGTVSLLGSANNTLRITSGALMFSGSAYTNASQTRVNSGTVGGFDEVIFGTTGSPREAIITVNALNAMASGTWYTAGELTITSTIATADGLTKSGAGALVLSAQNTYGGPTTVNAGELRLGAADALPTTGAVTLNGGQGVASGTILGQGVTTSVNTASRLNVAHTYLNLNGFNQKISGITGLSGSAGGAIGIVTNNKSATTGTLEIAGSSTFDGQLNNGSGILALRKSTGGLFTLTGSNNYTGATTITGGTLQIASTGRINNTSGVTINGGEFRYNSATALSQAITFSSGVLSGTGAIGVAVTVGGNNTISPGNSPGIQEYTAGLTMDVGGAYLWETNGWVGSTAGNLTNGFDQLQVSGGALNITSGTGAGQQFTIYVSGLTSGNVAGAVSGFSPGMTGTSFIIATSSSGITGFDAAKFNINTSLFTSNNTIPGGYGFTISQDGNNLVLTYGTMTTSTYSLSATASNAAIRVGGSTTFTAGIQNAGPNSIAYTGLSLTLGSGAATSGTVVAGGTNTGNFTYTGTVAGGYSFTPVVTSATDTSVNVGAVASGTTTGSVTVYNPAAANAISGTYNVGVVLTGGTLSQGLSITNTAPNDGFSEKLNASFGSLTGVTTTGSISLLAASSTSSAMSVFLSQLSACSGTGSAVVNFQTDGQGTSGLAAESLASQTVTLVGTFLDPATPSFTL
ncbi:MAG: beta strand repeat-containing protein, partial [Planctomycetia bacterium]